PFLCSSPSDRAAPYSLSLHDALPICTTSCCDAEPTEHGQRRHDRVPVSRIDVFCWPVRDVLRVQGQLGRQLAIRANRAERAFRGDDYDHPDLLVLTAQFGVFAAERGDVFALRRWYALSALLGTVFLIGQGYEYFHFVQTGTTIPGSVY